MNTIAPLHLKYYLSARSDEQKPAELICNKRSLKLATRVRAEALRAVEQQLANLYAEEVRERGRNSFLARTLEDVRDTLAAIEKGGGRIFFLHHEGIILRHSLQLFG
jgi:hypothetical protein